MNTQQQLIAFEAARSRLPIGVQIIYTARDYIVIEARVASDSNIVQRSAVGFDLDRDTRSLDGFGALYLRDRHIALNIVGLAEKQGCVSWVYSDPATVEFARRPLQEAFNAALWPYDRWSTEPYQLAPMLPDGTLDCANLPRDSFLRLVPEHTKLGRVRAKS